jgi:hypothetical protein
MLSNKPTLKAPAEQFVFARLPQVFTGCKGVRRQIVHAEHLIRLRMNQKANRDNLMTRHP